jgi:hypothetical protein
MHTVKIPEVSLLRPGKRCEIKIENHEVTDLEVSAEISIPGQC